MSPIATHTCFGKPVFVLMCIASLAFFAPKANSQCDLHVSMVFHPNPYCYGDVVHFEAVVTGGTQPYSYVWGPWPNGNPIWSKESYLDLTMDTIYWFNVWVTDDNGCTATAHYKAYPPLMNVDVDITLNGCTAADQYALWVNPNAPTYTYQWSNGGNTNPIYGTPGNTYTVTVTNQNGCSKVITSEEVPPYVLAEADVSGPDHLCPNVNAEVSTTSSPDYSYAWSNGGTGPNSTINGPGTYSVTVTNTESGCTEEDEIVIAQTPATPAQFQVPPMACASGNSTVSLLNTSAYTQIAWSNGDAGPTVEVIPLNTYTVTLTEANGCTTVADFTLDEYYMETPVILGPADICLEQETVTLQTSPAFTSYIWDTGQTTPSIVVTDAGTYSVTVTDVHGCMATVQQTVAQAPMPYPTIAPVTPFCNGSSQTIQVQGGPFASYAWSNGATSPSIQATAAGTYTVTVSNQQQCTATASAVASTAGASPNAQITALPTSCNGTATLMATGGGSYLWSNGATTPSITTTSSGSYTVTVTNSSGCTATANGQATINAAPTVQINGPTGLCPGSTADLAATGGFASYLWSNGSTSANISVSQGDNYTVTVTNAAGCTATASFPVFFAAQPTANITGPASLCTGSNGTLTVVGNFATCTWTTGATLPAIPITQPGLYVVTVTNAQGCTATAQQAVTFGNSLAFDIVPTQTGCNGSATLSAGIGFNSYLWSNGATTPSITVSQAGPYSVTVTDQSGCSGNASESVSFPAPPTVSINGPAAVCEGSPASLVASGSNITNYLWSNGQTTASISITQSSTYAVTATDANGCTATASQPFAVLAPPMVDITGPNSVCIGNSATLALSGNFAQANWSTPAGPSSQASITATQPGTYAVTVTAANGCSATDAQTLSVSSSLSPTISSDLQACTPAGTLNAGPGYANYLWSNGATTPSINVAQIGNYSVTVSDASGCTGTATESVPAPVLPQASIQGSSSICTGGSTVFAVSGNFPQVVWSTGETTPSINVAQPGSYSVTATDANGCTAIASQNLVVSTSLSPAIASTMQPCAPAGTLHAGAGFAHYAWSNGATTPSIDVAQVGTYSVTVSDASGCTGTASTAVNMPVLPQVAIQGSPSVCTGGSTVYTALGSFPQVAWSNGQAGPSITVSQPGTYTVTATDASGCTSVASQNLSIGSSLTPDIAAAMQPCLGTATLHAGAGYATYHWSNGATTPSIDVAQAANYFVTVSDASGCTGIASEAVTMPALPTVQVSGPAAVCAGTQASLTVSGSYSSIHWSNGTNAPSIVVTQPGTYAVTVTDANGCTATDSQPLVVNPVPAPDILPNNIGCNGTGSLTAGSGFASYLWSNGATTPSINIAQAPNGGSNNYSVTVTNANGCSGQDQISVTFPAPPTAAISGANQLCEGYSETLTVPGNFVAYEWSTGETTPSIAIATGGNYSVTVTDGNGCTDEAAWTVTELPTQYTSLENYSCNIANVGTETTTLTSQSGCDSVVTTTTLLNPALVGSLSLSACPGETASFNGAPIWAGSSQDFVFTSSSGCDSILTVTVAELPAVHLEWTATPSCWNGSNGTVVLEGNAGTPPYRYAMDGGSLKSSPSFLGLSAGQYSVMVQDGNGCKMQMPVNVPATQPTVIELGDGVIHCGDAAALLEPEVISGDEAAIQWRWSNGQTTKQASIVTPGMYHLTADDGCEVQDFQTLVMPGSDWDRGYFYVPNSFSPDGNAINDHFMALVGADVEVRKFEFMVFDRWGNSMYTTFDHKSLGWDGQHREATMKPAVFAWYLKAIVVDCRGEDKEIFMEGGVTVMR
ncbi:MAG: gliding motility-associated C-terminal domain-containing protein [Saprospiraceae bacterium]|nr:gliding motility-associated C-terminal domain-containing protein [Saprospiraceae bacterium]